MTGRLIGAVLTFVACGYLGFSKAAAYKRAERELEQLVLALDFMEQELSFRMPDLPELCRVTAGRTGGQVGSVLDKLAEGLEGQAVAEVGACMTQVLDGSTATEKVKSNLRLLGKTLGRFDLQGQLSGIAAVKELCSRDLEGHRAHREEYIRLCRTLALCAGAALVILLI